MRAFVTGACGLIGSHVVDALLERGDEVLALDNLATGRREHLAEHPRLDVVIDTITDRGLVHRLLEDMRPDVVIHAAASYADPDDWHGDALTNCIGTVNAVEGAIKAGARRFIYFQTSLCYGLELPPHPITPDHPLSPATTSYAISKTAAEDYVRLSGLDFVSFRLANVIGSRSVSGPLPAFYQRLRNGERCIVTETSRDFVSVADLTPIVLASCDGTGKGVYHFSTGSATTVKELFDEVARAMGLTAHREPEIRAVAADDTPFILLDSARTQADFGTIEFTPLADTVASAVAYYDRYGLADAYTHLRLETAET